MVVLQDLTNASRIAIWYSPNKATMNRLTIACLRLRMLHRCVGVLSCENSFRVIEPELKLVRQGDMFVTNNSQRDWGIARVYRFQKVSLPYFTVA